MQLLTHGSAPPRPELQGRPSILLMWLGALRGNPVLHRVRALASDLTPAELDRLRELALGSRGENSEALRWFLFHTSRVSGGVSHVSRHPQEYQV